MSLAETPKNENLLIAACHFWSNIENAFLFGHGPMYLLGSVYHMLHQTTYMMHTSQKISCVNGPWWFVQIWLQLYM
jgi:hypothetical protein